MYSKVTVFMKESMSRLSPVCVMQREMLPLLLLLMHTEKNTENQGREGPRGASSGAPLQVGPLLVKVHKAA